MIGGHAGLDTGLDAVTATAWASAVASGVLYYGLAYWFYLTALRQVPASSAATSFYLIPVFGVTGGFLLLGERLGATQLLGALLVLAAVSAILRRSGEETAASAEAGTKPQPASARGSSNWLR